MLSPFLKLPFQRVLKLAELRWNVALKIWKLIVSQLLLILKVCIKILKKNHLSVVVYLPLEPLAPTNFSITNKFEGIQNITAEFEWNPPLGSGPEYVVDGYQLSVMTDTDIVEALYVLSTSWNMILDYNVEYAVSIVSINCVGNSNEVTLRNILFGKKNVRSRSLYLALQITCL